MKFVEEWYVIFEGPLDKEHREVALTTTRRDILVGDV